jgi:3-hydroxybutyryl-CoA dehydrogenase
VEVTPGPATSPAAVDAVCAFLMGIGKVPVRLKRDAPGFILNRVQFAGLSEAIRLVEEDVADAASVDLVARLSFLLRHVLFGPLAAHDYFGRKQSSQGIFTYLANATGNEQYRPGALFADKVAAEAAGEPSTWYEPGTLPPLDSGRCERLLVELLQFLRERGLMP